MLRSDLRSDRGDRATAPGSEPIRVVSFSDISVERHEYRAPASSRWFGLGGTVLTACLIVASFLVTLSNTFVIMAPSPSLTVMEIRPPASPPETPPEKWEAAKPLKNSEAVPEALPVKPTTVPLLPVAKSIPTVTPIPADTALPGPEIAAPKTAPAPSAPQAASNDPDTWEGRVLAALNKQRRYPRIAQARRQQGVPWIRFVMDRDGKVLSSRLERSSGFADLDREAVALVKRASPLPEPPDSKPGDTLELVVPVEFFLSVG